jgi:hypothetical protein
MYPRVAIFYRSVDWGGVKLRLKYLTSLRQPWDLFLYTNECSVCITCHLVTLSVLSILTSGVSHLGHLEPSTYSAYGRLWGVHGPNIRETIGACLELLDRIPYVVIPTLLPSWITFLLVGCLFFF